MVTDPMTMVYHELRSPLALVATAARSAAVECEDEYLRNRCESIVRTAERMLRTAGRVMELAAASTTSDDCLFDPVEAVSEVVADYANLGVPLVLDLSRATEGRSPARGKERFEALLGSLIGNATDHGDAEHPVLVCVWFEGEALLVSIANEVSKVRSHRGLGLGLYISTQLAAQIGAAISTATVANTHRATVSMPVNLAASALAS